MLQGNQHNIWQYDLLHLWSKAFPGRAGQERYHSCPEHVIRSRLLPHCILPSLCTAHNQSILCHWCVVCHAIVYPVSVPEAAWLIAGDADPSCIGNLWSTSA